MCVSVWNRESKANSLQHKTAADPTGRRCCCNLGLQSVDTITNHVWAMMKNAWKSGVFAAFHVRVTNGNLQQHQKDGVPYIARHLSAPPQEWSGQGATELEVAGFDHNNVKLLIWPQTYRTATPKPQSVSHCHCSFTLIIHQFPSNAVTCQPTGFYSTPVNYINTHFFLNTKILQNHLFVFAVSDFCVGRVIIRMFFNSFRNRGKAGKST